MLGSTFSRYSVSNLAGLSLRRSAMNEESLFHQALQQPDAAARAAFLDQACANQPELRARLDKLLQAHDAPAGLFDKLAAEADTSDDASPGRWIDPADTSPPSEGPGTR